MVCFDSFGGEFWWVFELDRVGCGVSFWGDFSSWVVLIVFVIFKEWWVSLVGILYELGS